MYTLGYFFDWRTAALISSAFPIVTFVLMTPVSYLMQYHKYLRIRKSKKIIEYNIDDNIISDDNLISMLYGQFFT